MPLTIIRQDITKMNVDAIVNATNTDLQFNGGSNNSPLNSSHRAPHDNASLGAPHYVSSHGDLSDNPTPNHIHTSTTPNPTTPTSVSAAIFRAAGPPEIQAKLQEACDKLAPIQTGEAVLTPAFNLPAKYIIHGAGPNYLDWTPDQAAALLRTSYENALALAANHAINTIAFPLISTGSYGFPKTLALQIATTTIKDFLITHEMEVSLILFDKSSLDASQAVYGAIDQYITSAELPQISGPNLPSIQSANLLAAHPLIAHTTPPKKPPSKDSLKSSKPTNSPP